MLNQCDSPLLATAALAVIDIPACTVTFATAGHPPPLLRLPDGSIEKLETANGMMIGVSSELIGEVDEAPFPFGSQLVMYTDGLVERRDRPLQVGIDRAAAHLARSPPTSPRIGSSSHFTTPSSAGRRPTTTSPSLLSNISRSRPPARVDEEARPTRASCQWVAVAPPLPPHQPSSLRCRTMEGDPTAEAPRLRRVRPAAARRRERG